MKLSVITINYNNCGGLRKTIESVVNQTYKEFEYIVIDGGSTDGSVDVIKEYADRIDYWVSEPDKGIYNAMNKGIDVANGEYCLFINSGDNLVGNIVLEQCHVYLDGTDVVCGNIETDRGGVWRSPKEISLHYFYSHRSLPHPASFIKTSLLKKYHYDENLKIVSDWKFFIQVLVFDCSSYKDIDVIVSVFDTSGISCTNKALLVYEGKMVLKSHFSPIVYNYYEDNVVGREVELYNEIRESKFRKQIYTLNVLILRMLTLFKQNSWIRKYPLRLKD